MRKLLILFLVLLFVSVSEAQLRKMYTWIGRSTTSWTKISRDAGQKITILEVSADTAATTAVADTLWVAFNADTTSGNILPLYANVYGGESILFPPVYLDAVRIKSNVGMPVRIRYH